MKCIKSLFAKSNFILFLVIGLMMHGATAVGQEYKYEIGGMLGMSNYMGDANKNNPWKGFHPSFGAIFRKNVNFRWALKADLLMGKVSGNTMDGENVYPFDQQVEFSRYFYELGGQVEFNFLPYSDKYSYLQTSRLSPYLFTGLGFTLGSGEDTFFGLNFPLGIGVKYKVKNRINLGMEYSFRKLFSDSFDSPDKKGFNLNDPYETGSNIMKNKDWYTLIMFSVTWDFGPNDRKCVNLE